MVVGSATCCCHWHGLYYIGMAANRCRYKHRAAVNKYDNGGQNERKRGVTWDAIWDTTV